MFQFFLRARDYRIFKARSAGRDAENDRSRVASIAQLIEQSLTAAEAERTGLVRRLDDVLARAAVPLGNDTDEYLTREAHDSQLLHQLEAEISKAQRRIEELTSNIAHFQFLMAALLARFPDFKP
ncbi:hypothetical protein [Nitrobacter sp. TKz-YC02]|uniref:hypothetical protein n=1 Tax=Nitrobacter sp. TKz-YC02 TaxID=3398704 RepID=UPI003CEF6FB3